MQPIADSELKELLLQHDITDEDIKGTGKNGRVLKSDRMKVYTKLQSQKTGDLKSVIVNKIKIKDKEYTEDDLYKMILYYEKHHLVKELDLPNDAILNIILNTQPYELPRLYALNKTYQQILNAPYTLNLLSNQHFNKNIKFNNFNEFMEKYNKHLKNKTGLVIDLKLIYDMINKRTDDIRLVIAIGAVIEYIMAEILELAGNLVRDRGYYKDPEYDIVMLSDINKAIKNDEELNKTFKNFKMTKTKTSFEKSLLIVLSQVHPMLEKIDKKAIDKLNQLMDYLIEQMINKITIFNKQDFDELLQNLFIGALADHAISESTKALRNW